VCGEALVEGDECRSAGDCADGLACAGLTFRARSATLRAPGRCAPFLDAGELCDADAAISGCPAAMICDAADHVCRSTGHLGDPCEPRAQPGPEFDANRTRPLCVGGLYCEPTTRTCKPELADGASCEPASETGDEPCLRGRCDPATRRCAPRCPKAG
jgi:hypothetical protein